MANPGARRLFCARKATQSKVKGKAKTKVEGKSKVRAKVKEVLAVLRMRQRCPLCCQQLGLSLPGAMLWCFAVREIGWAFRAGFPGFALGTLQSMVIICDRDALKRPECRVRSHSGILSRGKNAVTWGFVEMASAGTSRWLVSSVFIVKKWQETGAIVRKVSSAHETRCLVRGYVRNGFRAKRDLHEADRARSGMSRKGIAREGNGGFRAASLIMSRRSA